MSPRPLLLGHRGARAVKAIPENTLSSFDLALAHGCDGFEFDVRLTADGEAVVCHDAKNEGIEIARASVEELPQLPRLREVLARYRHSAFLDIELKVVGAGENCRETAARVPRPVTDMWCLRFFPRRCARCTRKTPRFRSD